MGSSLELSCLKPGDYLLLQTEHCQAGSFFGAQSFISKKEWEKDHEQGGTQEQQSHLQEGAWEPMEAGIGSFELWVPEFWVVTVELDRVLDSSVQQEITRLRSGYQKVFL